MPKGKNKKYWAEKIRSKLMPKNTFPYDHRLIKSVVNTLIKIPEKDLANILNKDVCVAQIQKTMLIPLICEGTVTEKPSENILEDNLEQKIIIRLNLVAFHSSFCDEPEADNIYDIAHEFAHVFLDHYKNNKMTKRRKDLKADEQVIKWGFEKELWESGRSYIEKEKIKKMDKEGRKNLF